MTTIYPSSPQGNGQETTPFEVGGWSKRPSRVNENQSTGREQTTSADASDLTAHHKLSSTGTNLSSKANGAKLAVELRSSIHPTQTVKSFSPFYQADLDAEEDWKLMNASVSSPSTGQKHVASNLIGPSFSRVVTSNRERRRRRPPSATLPSSPLSKPPIQPDPCDAEQDSENNAASAGFKPETQKTSS
ncbi:hypothetical protein TREMEDRAFT_64783 [Tremella mesenterica DSM 1558]|uniref:uncharacterized protein n=1 Tax=Tremella mesenterica (strain ATCC 24925 / CBS 8224 / DSM 1558 / NBRC 9311 / NRRL Y-6157 / RJB 2259-6 / UBC 559-6) TaxID=578456 RepID=UPI0003F4968E|nr:uncharacterized protein TREMEDRAFT_64783 [Tremella mesenterica DSM 1558]EIW66928.1 hypothetical protein TREMEDRAFT_64783 [Tremella mesenterica DSM 1558]